MIINKKQMGEINSVQYEIFKAFHFACIKLNLKYYLVHGSLLGALRHQGFFPMDDDIDVAMFRKDYDILVTKGQKYLGNRFFIQSNYSEKDYPLIFGKIRAHNTAFIQPVLNNCDVHKGIYIDIFPIDNYPTNKWKKKILKIKGYLYYGRIIGKLNFGRKKTIKTKIREFIYTLLMPCWETARNKLCNLYSNVKPTGLVIVRGGKANEVGISSELFGEPVNIKFEDLESYAPNKTEKYLELIYGDFMNYEPMGKYMVSENEVKISADIIDVNKSYKEYI